MHEPAKIRVVLADDHTLVRQGIRALLDTADDIAVVGEAENGHEALRWVEWVAPDVLVVDISMPRLDGLQTIARIRANGGSTRTVVLSMFADDTLVREALRCGASGYVIKRSVKEELLLAIRAAHRGELYLSPAVSSPIVADSLRQAGGKPRPSPFQELTPREREVLQLVAEGATSISIAVTLGISKKTVDKHRANLMKKLNVHDVAGLVRTAAKRGLIFDE